MDTIRVPIKNVIGVITEVTIPHTATVTEVIDEYHKVTGHPQ